MVLDDPRYNPTRRDQCSFVSSVPLGGLGAGTVELRQDGSFREWQIFNNLGNSPTLGIWKYFPSFDLLNSLMAVKVNDKAYVLETKPPAGLPGIEAIDYNGKFPFANLTYHLPGKPPLKLSLEAFSGFIPHNPDDSGLPAFGLSFNIANTLLEPIDIRLVLSIVNPFGQDCQTVNQDGYGMAECGDGRSGLAVTSLDTKAKYILGGRDDEETLKEFWSIFTNAKAIEGQSAGQGQRIALIASLNLEPQATKQLRFVIGWFFPDHKENGTGPLVGHRYEKLVGSAVDAVRLFAGKYNDLHDKSAAWRDALLNASWPEWASDWLINLQANIIKSSWWVRDGRFITMESVHCPNAGPLHVIDLADWPVLDLFPDLELGLLRRFAQDQYPDGRMPEQYNLKAIDNPLALGSTPSITNPGGRDLLELSPKYAVEVFHRFKETGEKRFLEDTYPSVKKAMTYAMRFDQDGDGLPDHITGLCRTSWDLWENGYLPSYTATLWLAGLLAMEKLARLMNDNEYADSVHKQLEKGHSALDSKLWNGEYYAFYANEAGEKSPICMIDQIYGELFASFVGLGQVLPSDRTLSALRAIAKYNSQATDYGLVCGAMPDGSIVIPPDDRVQIIVCWMLPAPIGLIAHGDLDEGLGILKRVYDMATKVHPGGLWDFPDCVIAETGEYHPRGFHHYLRTQCFWSLMKILNGWNYNAAEQTLSVEPVYNPDDCHGPWIVPTAYGTLSQKITGGRQRIRLDVLEGELTLKRLVIRSRIARGRSVTVRLGNKTISHETACEDNMIRMDFKNCLNLIALDKIEVDILEK